MQIKRYLCGATADAACEHIQFLARIIFITCTNPKRLLSQMASVQNAVLGFFVWNILINILLSNIQCFSITVNMALISN